MASEGTSELEVLLLDQLAGRLTLTAGVLQFQYAPQWLEQPKAMALSQSLPLQAEPFDDRTCRPFLQDYSRKANSDRRLPSDARSLPRMISACWRPSEETAPVR